MERSLAPRIALCLALLAVMPCARAATKPAGDPWATATNLEIKDARLPDAVEALFKGTGINYAIEADIAEITVRNLSIEKEPLRSALSTLLNATGTVQSTRGVGKDQVVTIGPGPVWSKKVSPGTQDVPFQDVLKDLFRQAGVPDWTVDPRMPNYDMTLPSKDVSFIKIIAAIAKGISARFGWGFIEAGDPWQRMTGSMEMKDSSFSEVVDALLKEAGVSYTVDPSVAGLKVTAVLKNVTMQDAFRQVCKAAGVVYRVEGGVYMISARPSITENAASGPGAPGMPGQYGPPGYGTGARSEVVTLQHLTAGELAPILANRGSLRVTSTSNNKLVLTGTAEELSDAQALIEALDVAPRMVDPVEVTLILSITIDRPGKKPAVYQSLVKAIGSDGSPIPLDLQRMTTYASTAQSVANGKTPKQTATNPQLSMLYATLTPTLTDKGELSVTGTGYVAWVLQPGKLDQVKTSFNVAASGQNRQIIRANIASGEVSLADGKASYQVQLIAKTQPGKVPAETQLQPSYGGYGGGGGYGGNSYGGRAGYGGGGSSTSNRSW